MRSPSRIALSLLALGLLTSSWLPAQFVRTAGIQTGANRLPDRPALVDWDRDGTLDIALADSGALTVWRHSATGFVKALQTTQVLQNVYSIVAGDFTGDGRPDLLAGGDGLVSGTYDLVLVESTTTGYIAHTSSTPRSYFSGMAAGDYDGDGVLDLALEINDEAWIYPGDGQGGFGAPVVHLLWPGVEGMHSVDLDGDDHLDLVFVHARGSLVFVLWGNGVGGFSWTFSATQSQPSSVTAADFDRDGDLDLVVSSASIGDVEILTNRGGRTLVSSLRQFTLASPDMVLAGDFDRNGFCDVATVHWTAVDGLVLLLGNGRGGLSGPMPAPVLTTTRMLAVVGDLDGDGGIDVLAGESQSDAQLFTATQTGLFSTSAYGAGTGGCAGAPVLRPTRTPFVGTADFALTATNAPSRALGLVAISDTQVAMGSDPLQLGANFLIGLNSGVILQPFAATTTGTAQAPLEIPNVPGLQGLAFYAQGLWLETRPGFSCSASPVGVVTSQGLAIVIL